MAIQFKTKDLKEHYNGLVFGVGYCDAQNLLSLSKVLQIGYTSGTYGWSSDVYVYCTKSGQYVLISTGYRPVSNAKGIDIKPYELKAEKIHYDQHLSINEKRKKITNLLDKWVMASIAKHIERGIKNDK